MPSLEESSTKIAQRGNLRRPADGSRVDADDHCGDGCIPCCAEPLVNLEAHGATTATDCEPGRRGQVPSEATPESGMEVRLGGAE